MSERMGRREREVIPGEQEVRLRERQREKQEKSKKVPKRSKGICDPISTGEKNLIQKFSKLERERERIEQNINRMQKSEND